MKSASALIFASAVAADYAYGGDNGYAAATPSNLGYTTLYPGHGKSPVTVTAQYQPVPTFVNGKWSEYEVISTVITDYYGQKIPVTATDEEITVWQTQTMIAHTANVAVPGNAKPTDFATANYTNKVWNELYRKIYEVPFNHVGPHAIAGYGGNPKCQDSKDEQTVQVKEYSNGKWSTYDQIFTYGAPTPSETAFEAPGTYTISANDVTVAYPTTIAGEDYYAATANQPCTYGGQTTYVNEPTTITAPYAAYQIDGEATRTIVLTKTITCNDPGQYTIVKPTTTVYPYDTTVSYPTITGYAAGEYQYPAQTVTITKPHETYTCSASQTYVYPVPTVGNPSDPSAYPVGPGGYQPGPTAIEPAPTAIEPYPSAIEPAPTAIEPYPAPIEPAPTAIPEPISTTDLTPAPTAIPEPISTTTPPFPDPSSEFKEPAENYGRANAGVVKRGGVIQRRKAEAKPVKAGAKRVIFV